MKTIIMAGGMGTRISSVASDVPKPMIPVWGKPILEYQLECLRDQGLKDIILSTGHLGHIIKAYFGDGGRFGVTISYFHEDEPLGTAGALIALKETLTEDFLLINGDMIFDMDMSRIIKTHKKNGALATLATHPNSHPYDSALIVADRDSRIIGWLNKEDERTIYKNRVNAGIHVLSPKILEPFSEVKKTDLDKDVLKPLVLSGKLFAYDTPEYIRDMGTSERYRAVCRDVATGKVAVKNLRRKQKAVFLDRDGVINVYKEFLTRWEDMELLAGAAEAIARINESGYLVIVITNQPVIARGGCTWEELAQIHNAMETLLGKAGSYVDDIFICPHHPDRGFPGERPEYKIDCDCRKPKPGLILMAAEKYNIDLSQSYMVGDSTSDVQAGFAAGCTPIYINENEDCKVARRYKSLYAFTAEAFHKK